MTDFLSELKRRKVIKVGITYAVMAFVTMQLVEILFPFSKFLSGLPSL